MANQQVDLGDSPVKVSFVAKQLPKQIFRHHRREKTLDRLVAVTFAEESGRGICEVERKTDSGSMTDVWAWKPVPGQTDISNWIFQESFPTA